MTMTPHHGGARAGDSAHSAVVAATATAVAKTRSWARTNVGTRMPGRDRTWRGTHTIRMRHGLDAPGAHALRSTLRQLASLAPEHRIFQRPGYGYTRWITPDRAEIDERCGRMVVPLDAAPGDLDALQKQLHDGRDHHDLPFRIATGGGTVAVSVEHPLADGRTLTQVLSELVRRASDGEPPLELARASIGVPLARAIFDYYGRQPRRVVETLRTDRD
nr:hypothetical protein [Micromonospora sp. DSM 115978]